MAVIYWRAVVRWGGLEHTETELRVNLTEQLDLEGGGGGRSAQFRILPGWNTPALIGEGLRPEEMTVELYAGDTLVMSGQPKEVATGRDKEPIQITLSETVRQDQGQWPAARLPGQQPVPPTGPLRSAVLATQRAYQHAITAAQWSDPGDNALGRRVPRVYGSPGSTRRAGSVAHVVGAGTSQVVVSDAAKSIVSGGANTFIVWDSTTSATITTGPTRVETNQGDVVYTITAPGSINLEDPLYVSWVGARGQEGTQTLGGLVKAVLGASTSRIDWARVNAALPELDQYQVAGFVEDAVNPTAWLRDTVSAVVPMSVQVSGDGVYIALWPVDGTTAGAVDHIAEGVDAYRTAGPTARRQRGVSRVQLEYAYDPRNTTYTAVERIDRDATPYARLAESIYGDAVERLQAPFIEDAATAQQIALARLRWRSRAPLRVTLDMDVTTYGLGGSREVVPGDLVEYTDTSIGWLRKLMTVTRRQQAFDRLIITLETL